MNKYNGSSSYRYYDESDVFEHENENNKDDSLLVAAAAHCSNLPLPAMNANISKNNKVDNTGNNNNNNNDIKQQRKHFNGDRPPLPAKPRNICSEPSTSTTISIADLNNKIKNCPHSKNICNSHCSSANVNVNVELNEGDNYCQVNSNGNNENDKDFHKTTKKLREQQQQREKEQFDNSDSSECTTIIAAAANCTTTTTTRTTTTTTISETTKENDKNAQLENTAKQKNASSIEEVVQEEEEGKNVMVVRRQRKNSLQKENQTEESQQQQQQEKQEKQQQQQPQQRKPQVPPKPQLDIVRYSMANAKDDMDLDTILSELLELEDQLSSAAGDQLVLGLPTLPKASNLSTAALSPKPTTALSQIGQSRPLVEIQHACDTNSSQNAQNYLLSKMSESDLKSLNYQSNNLNKNSQYLSRSTVDACASPDADSAFGDSSSTDCSSGSSSSSSAIHHNHATYSSANYWNFEFASSTTCHTPSPTYQATLNNTSYASTSGLSSVADGFVGGAAHSAYNNPMHSRNTLAAAPISSVSDNDCARSPSSLSYAASCVSASSENVKAQKIREALEKMKEAKMKKIYVKIFLDDGSTKGILVDERWTVAETMRQLADRLGVVLTAEHAIVEEYPDLFFTRIYEDHEYTVENIEDWLADSKNKLHFRRVPDKYEFLKRPQEFLLSKKSVHRYTHLLAQQPLSTTTDPTTLVQQLAAANWSQHASQQLIKEILEDQCDGAGSTPMELDGWLMLKADGRKSWKRHYFILRSSGLYYNPKSGKQKHGAARDLQCLMNVYNNQIYKCTEWKKKYKAPTEFGFAIKHPRIQLKTSKYIKYVCADDEATLNKWISALRITKNGFKTLYNNHENALNYHGVKTRGTPLSNNGIRPIRVEVPNISAQRLSSLDAINASPRSGRFDAVDTSQTHGSSPLSTSYAQIETASQIAFKNDEHSRRTARDNFATNDQCPTNFVNSSTSLLYAPTQTATIVRTPRSAQLQQDAVFEPVAGKGATLCAPHYVDMRERSPAGVFFDQEECGTIKRQPVGSMQSSSLGVESDSAHSFVGMSKQTSSVTPTQHNFQNPAAQEDERDSDEEDEDDQLPPPPPQERLHFATSSPANIALSAPQSTATTPRKVPPPPPPKRSDATSSEHQQQQQYAQAFQQHVATTTPLLGGLYAELQKATARQKKRIEDY